MKIPDSMIEKIAQAILKGRSEQIQHVNIGATPTKESKRLKKLVAACDVDGSMAKFSKKSGFAHWEGIVRISVRERMYRYGILILDRFDRRTMYAIPFGQLDQITELPECLIAMEDMLILLDMAEKISSGWREILIDDLEISKTDLKSPNELDFSQGDTDYEERQLVELFQRIPELLVIFIAALDAQIRILLHSYVSPITLYNFVESDSTSVEWIEQVLRAVSLSDASPDMGAGSLLVSLQKQRDYDTWCACERLMLLSVGNDTELNYLKEMLTNEAAGGSDGETLKQMPIILSRTTIDDSNVVNLTLPEKHGNLSHDEIVLLRAAMTRCLTEEFCDFVRRIWRQEIYSPRAELWTHAEQWRQMLSYQMTSAICPTIEVCDDLDALLQTVQYKLWRPEAD